MNPPRTRRRFRSLWDEVHYLYDKFLYWYYLCGDRSNARPYARRLKELLSREAGVEEAIFGRECLSLLAEFDDDLDAAIRHRQAEIEGIERLREISRGTPQQQHALSGYGPEALSDRLDLLASLQERAGNLERAIRCLEQSERLCAEHGLEFKGQEMLREYRAERARAAGAGSIAQDGGRPMVRDRN